MTDRSLTYRDAGVDIEAGDRLVERIRPAVRATQRPEVIGGIGGFGGLFALPPGKYREPVLVAGTDGVGTKLRLAIDLARHDTIGIDLVAMCANDVVVQGAEPLFFLDYYATGHLDVDVAADVVRGIAEGCRRAGAALIGGETAEMPGMYAKADYDLAGFCVGAVERDELVDGTCVSAGDVLIALPSSGPHANGYSLIRRILEASEASLDTSFEAGATLGEVLLAPTEIYVGDVLAVHRAKALHGAAHITGGGIPGNVVRILGDRLDAHLDPTSWQFPAIFEWLRSTGGVSTPEMLRTFNCGLGMVLAVPADRADEALSSLREGGRNGAFVVGDLRPGSGEVHVA